MITTRFAPSPTGHLHVGNVRAALHNFLWAKKHGGRFILRIDDTDAERSRTDYADSIRADLEWLGLIWDEEHRQSDRFALYEAKFDALRTAGRIYACYETPEELDLRRKVLLGRGLPPVYERQPESASVPDGRAPHWRFRLDHDAPIIWNDRVRGEQRFDPKLLSDPVIRRENGSWLYMLPSAIDDAEMGITDVVRGEDHVTNTAAQLQMFDAMGVPRPAFAHEALLVGVDGKLSKRMGSIGVADFRDAGIEPITILAFLARLGTSDPIVPETQIAPLIAGIDFGRFGRAPARFDEDELKALNARTVHSLAYTDVRNLLPEEIDEAGWIAIRPNLETLADAADWWRVVTGPIEANVADEDRAFLASAAEHAKVIDWSGDPWGALIETLKTATGRKGKSLFQPLRRALTGRDHGPDMAALLPLIGREQAIARLSL